MSAFNRLVVVLISLLILAGAVITVLVATGISAPDAFPVFRSQLQWVADASGGGAVAITAVGIVIALGMIALLFFELMPPRRPVPLLISSTEQGIATIDRDSVCELAEKVAATIHNVRDVHCSVGERAGGLVISCQASVALATNIPELSAELQGKIKSEVEELTGLPVTQVDVKTEYEEPEARRLAVR